MDIRQNSLITSFSGITARPRAAQQVLGGGIPTLKADTLTLFGAAPTPRPIYSFGTSGYREADDDKFNDRVVRQIASAIADHLVLAMERNRDFRPVLVGGDTRDKTRAYLPVVATILEHRGLDVYTADGDIPSPVLAYAASHFDQIVPGAGPTAGAMLMTASHNPWEYGGFNFLTPDGAVAPEEVTKSFEHYQAHPLMRRRPRKGSTTVFDPYPAYRHHIKNVFGIDFDAIKKANLQIFYDPLYATGRRYFPRLLKDEGIDITTLHDTDQRPDGFTGMPEPTLKQLGDLQNTLRQAPKTGLKLGLANDGDSDRFGVLDEKGDFVAPNDVLALIIYHLIKNRGQNGSVVRSLATTHYLDALASTTARKYSKGKKRIQTRETPVGYKYIADEIIEGQKPGHTPVLIGGESSGGATVIGHIPEKDGLLVNLLMAELVAKEGKPLSEILADIKNIVPKKFANREMTVHTPNADAVTDHFDQLIEQGGRYAGYAIDTKRSQEAGQKLKDTYNNRGGSKLYFKNGSWILLRKSGTEPVFRVFIETVAKTQQASDAMREKLFAAINKQLKEQFGIPAENIAVKN